MNPARARGGRLVWVIHAGALGDSVLAWPLLRALRAGGRSVTFVAPPSKAALAADELGAGVEAVSLEQPRFTRLWQGAAAVRPSDRAEGVAEVFTCVADRASEGGERWFDGAAAMFPGARVVEVGPPGSASRAAAWSAVGADGPAGRPEPRENPDGPVVLHVGAGSEAKRWPIERWLAVAVAMRREGRRVEVIAGEVEAERFTAAERRVLAAMGGRVFDTLGPLAALLRTARVDVGADTGPTHLAAQIGVPTVALFGPTDPSVWGPVGPRVRVLAPNAPTGMAWLEPAAVVAAIRAAAP